MYSIFDGFDTKGSPMVFDWRTLSSKAFGYVPAKPSLKSLVTAVELFSVAGGISIRFINSNEHTQRIY